jgi:hypothetical protein
VLRQGIRFVKFPRVLNLQLTLDQGEQILMADGWEIPALSIYTLGFFMGEIH